MSDPPAISPPAGQQELLRLTEILCVAFNESASRFASYVELVGIDNLRVVREGGEVAGGLGILPMGQWFGGRRVPMAGIAAVATAPQYRGRGSASRLLRGMIEELHAGGWFLSVLFPATQPVYRRVGYELAGMRFQIRLPTRAIDLADRRLEIRPIEPADNETIERLYHQRAMSCPGNLDRCRAIWHRVRHPRGEPAMGYAVCRAGRVEGYVYFTQRKTEDGYYDLKISDLVALTPEAARRLLTFFADHRSLAEAAVWHGSPADAMLTLLAEQHYTIKSAGQWMLRVVDVPGALTARGYPAGLQAELHLAVRDDVLAANDGPFVLKVADGHGTVEPGGRGSFRIDIRGLAALYSGYSSPADLLLAGCLQADDRDSALAASIFAGPLPWMPDAF